MSVIINGSGTVNGVTTQDNVVVNGPAFSAYQSTAQTSVANGASVKLTMTTEDYDYGSCYDNVNSRFQPTVAGVYHLSAGFAVTTAPASVGAALYCSVWKNGAETKRGSQGSLQVASMSADIYLNGTTDYVEAYMVQSTGATTNTIASAVHTFFQAHMVRPG